MAHTLTHTHTYEPYTHTYIFFAEWRHRRLVSNSYSGSGFSDSRISPPCFPMTSFVPKNREKVPMQGVPPLCGRMPIRGWRDGMSTFSRYVQSM